MINLITIIFITILFCSCTFRIKDKGIEREHIFKTEFQPNQEVFNPPMLPLPIINTIEEKPLKNVQPGERLKEVETTPLPAQLPEEKQDEMKSFWDIFST